MPDMTPEELAALDRAETTRPVREWRGHARPIPPHRYADRDGECVLCPLPRGNAIHVDRDDPPARYETDREQTP